MQTVDVYTTEQCPYCKFAKQLLTDKGVAFNELRIDKDSKLREALNARQPGLRTVPQIFIGDTHVGGYDDLVKLEQANQLDVLLQKTTSAE